MAMPLCSQEGEGFWWQGDVTEALSSKANTDADFFPFRAPGVWVPRALLSARCRVVFLLLTTDSIHAQTHYLDLLVQTQMLSF